MAAPRRVLFHVALSAACAIALSACFSSGPSRPASRGTASVACAGSLLKLFHDRLAPAFTQRTGDAVGGPPCEGSTAVAQEILANEIDPGVFLSLGTKAIGKLVVAHRARFSLSIAADPLVVAYSSSSRYYAQLQAIRSGRRPLSALFGLLASPGFRLGRTDPAQDPQGAYFLLMCELAQRVLPLPSGEVARALGTSASNPVGATSQLFDEAALPTDIATGIVDAGSAYLPQARQYHLDYLTLPPTLDFASTSEASLYHSVQLVVHGTTYRGGVIEVATTLVLGDQARPAARDAAADRAFVAFLLGARAQAILRAAGFVLHAPVLALAPGAGSAAQVLPAAVLQRFEALGGTVAS